MLTLPLTEDQVFTLSLLAQVVLNACPRDIHLGAHPPTPLVVYSDASFEKSVLRLGRVTVGLGPTCSAGLFAPWWYLKCSHSPMVCG